MPTNKFFITCDAFCGQWTADPSPTNLIQSKAIFLFRSWINGPGGAKNIIGSYPFARIENRPAPLSFVKLSLSAQIYYFCNTNLGAVNHSANLRFAKTLADMKKDVENKPIVIKNPSEKMKSFIKKMEEDKINRRQELLSTKNFTFSI